MSVFLDIREETDCNDASKRAQDVDAVMSYMSADHFNAEDRVFGAQSFAEVLFGTFG